MAEPVRLVIWDLDETFWKGTLTEGGITEYVQRHHDIVVELAMRGIMSSICSKNNFASVESILRGRGIWDYFVFPSIDWTSKSARVAALVDAVQLRPETIMFVDDNPSNRGEVAAFVPGIQVADETTIAAMLDSPLFKGKDDRGLTRLAQYKLLERRKSDEVKAGSDNAEFLRGCNIEVMIETDIEAHVDRVIELVNRTNQLNFTKLRLPEDKDKARARLLNDIDTHQHKLGLVRVRDKYGDYGFCGLYGVHGTEKTSHLYYYCFSCRILGMGVETWLYQRLGRPIVRVVGEVLTDLSKEMDIDWIKLVDSFDHRSADPPVDGRTFYVRGGCDLDPLAHYLRVKFGRVVAETNVTERGLFKRFDSSINLLAASGPSQEVARAEFAALGMTLDEYRTELFGSNVPAGTAFLMSTWADSQSSVFRHRESGVEVCYVIAGFMRDLTTTSDAELEAHFQNRVPDEAVRKTIRVAVRHLRENYQHRWAAGEAVLKDNIRRICRAIPEGCLLFLMLQNPTKKQDGHLVDRIGVLRYNQWVSEAVADMDHVRLIDVARFIESPDEVSEESGDHFHRKVYYRLYQEILRLS